MKKIFWGIIATIAIASIVSLAITKNIAEPGNEPIEELVHNLQVGDISPSHFRDVLDKQMKDGTITWDEYKFAMEFYYDKISDVVDDLEVRLRHDMITPDEYKMAIDSLSNDGTISTAEHDLAMEAYYKKKGIKSPYALDDETKAREEERIKKQAEEEEERIKKQAEEKRLIEEKSEWIKNRNSKNREKPKYDVWYLTEKEFNNYMESINWQVKIQVSDKKYWIKKSFKIENPSFENGMLKSFTLVGGYSTHGRDKRCTEEYTESEYISRVKSIVVREFHAGHVSSSTNITERGYTPLYSEQYTPHKLCIFVYK